MSDQERDCLVITDGQKNIQTTYEDALFLFAQAAQSKLRCTVKRMEGTILRTLFTYSKEDYCHGR